MAQPAGQQKVGGELSPILLIAILLIAISRFQASVPDPPDPSIVTLFENNPRAFKRQVEPGTSHSISTCQAVYREEA